MGLTVERIESIVIHHSASRLETTLEDIRGWHLERGFDDIGYHFVIESGGDIRYGRPLPQTGAHAKPNDGRIGICLVGDNTKPGREWTTEQLLSGRRLVDALQMVWPALAVEGHRDVVEPGHTECPGVEIEHLLD